MRKIVGLIFIGLVLLLPGGLKILCLSLEGDIDNSGKVDGQDLILLGRAFGSAEDGERYDPACDLDGDGLVDGQDLAVVGMNFGRSLEDDEEIGVIDRVFGRSGPPYVADEIIVKFREDADPTDVGDFMNEEGGSAIPTHEPVDFTLIQLPEGMDVPTAVSIYNQNPDVEFAEPNFYRYPAFTPNDPFFRFQWHFTQINMEEAWDTQRGGSSDVIAAVIDSGIRQSLPDFAGTRFTPGYDFVDNDNNANDEGSDGFGHGSFVGGVIAQTTNNNFGVAGIAYRIRLMPLRVFPRTNGARVSDIIQAINWAVGHGADIINMSFGGPSGSNAESQAMNAAYQSGVTLVAAAGNEGNEDDFSGDVDYPARYDVVLAVGATDANENLAYYSSYGPNLDIVAPGGDTRRDTNGDGNVDGILQNTFYQGQTGFFLAQGTSFACPHAVGVAALLLSQGVARDPDAIYTILRSTATDLGADGRDNRFGYGLLDARAALEGLGLNH